MATQYATVRTLQGDALELTFDTFHYEEGDYWFTTGSGGDESLVAVIPRSNVAYIGKTQDERPARATSSATATHVKINSTADPAAVAELIGKRQTGMAV